MIEKVFKNTIYIKHRELMLCVLDLLIVLLSFCLAYWVKIDFKFPDMSHFNYGKAFVNMIIVLLVYAVSFFTLEIHKSLWKYVGPIESLRIVLSVILSTGLLMLWSTLGGMERAYLSIIVTGGLLTALIMFNSRLCYRLYRRYCMRMEGIHAKKAIIIGAGDAGYILVKEILQNEKLAIDVIGFVDDKKNGNLVAGYRVLGKTYDLPEIVQTYAIQVAFIAIPSANKKDIRRIFDLCQSLKLDTKIMREGDTLLADDLNGPKKYPVNDISIEDLLGRGEIHLDQQEIKSYITGKTIAITGAGGSIGSELCRQIIKFKPAQLIMIDINENSLYMLEQEFHRDRLHGKLTADIEIVSLIASIRDEKAINEIFQCRKPSVVFHAAAHKHVPLMETRPMEAIKNNVFGTHHVIKACIQAKVERFIMISTDKAVNPTNVMGATKRMTEMLLQAYGKNGITKMAAVRFGNVLGSNGSVIPIFKKQIMEGGPLTITDKNIIRYFMTIPEAAQLVLQAGYYADKGEIFVLDMGQPVKILDLAEKMIRLSGLEPYQDIDIIEIGLRPGEKMFEELRLDEESATRTKNNLIFKIHIMDINKEDVFRKLMSLQDHLDHKEKEAQLKAVLLDLIKDGKEAKRG